LKTCKTGNFAEKGFAAGARKSGVARWSTCIQAALALLSAQLNFSHQP